MGTGVTFDECVWNPPKVNMFTLLQIVFLVIFTSVPLNFMNDFLIENVLRAPTPTALNEQGELELLTGRFYKGMAQTVNNIGTSIMAVVSAPTSSTSLQNDTDNRRRQTKESMNRTSDRKRGMLINSMIGSHTDDDDRRTTEVPYDLENSSVRKSGIGNVNSGAVVPSGLSGRRHGKVKFFDLTILTPKEFDLRHRVSCDAYIETNGVTHIENRLTSKYYRHARLTAKRLGVDVEKILDPPYVSNTNQSFTEKIITGFQELDVDLTPISQIVPLAYQTEDCAQELINTLQFLETDLIKQRNLIMNGGRSSLTSKKNFNLNKDMKKIEEELYIFDLKWGLRDIREEDQKNFMYQQISKPKTFVAEKVAKSYLAAKQVLDSSSTLSDHQIGSNIIGLFVTDMLGVENVRSRCYHKKHKRDFKSHRAMSIQIKLLVCLLLIGVYGFCISICLSYGANKNSIWKNIWIIIVSLKCIFDLSVKEMLMSVIIGYGIPNIIKDDVAEIRQELITSGLKLLKPRPVFHLNRFSASDFIFSSMIVAKTYPHLIESKLVFMYRNADPSPVEDSLQCKRIQTSLDARHNNKFSWEALFLCALTFLLHFGSLHKAIQKVVVSTIPTSLFVVATFIMMLFSSNGGIVTILVGVSIIAFGPMTIHFMYSNETEEVKDDLETILDKLNQEDSDESIISPSDDDDEHDDMNKIMNILTPATNESINNEVVENEETNESVGTSSPGTSINSPSTYALSPITENEEDEDEDETHDDHDDQLSLSSDLLVYDNDDTGKGDSSMTRRESSTDKKFKRRRSQARRASLMKKRIANANQHLTESEEAVRRSNKNRLNKRLNQKRNQVNNNNDNNNNTSHVVKIPSTTLEEDEDEDEYTTVANSILNDGGQDDVDNDAIVSVIADGTIVRHVLSATKSAPSEAFIPARRRSTLNKSKTLKRRASRVIRDMKKKVAEAEVERDDKLNKDKANRFERMNNRLKARKKEIEEVETDTLDALDTGMQRLLTVDYDALMASGSEDELVASGSDDDDVSQIRSTEAVNVVRKAESTRLIKFENAKNTKGKRRSTIRRGAKGRSSNAGRSTAGGRKTIKGGRKQSVVAKLLETQMNARQRVDIEEESSDDSIGLQDIDENSNSDSDNSILHY